ncbi:MAG TPA: dTDP-4-dehydrorhamnose reductase [Candidatus Eisenbacteria bacterium]|nr:dTDP-4-dehydrorhamnose reductase [Candidatus Eisenbacteria bacterium]
MRILVTGANGMLGRALAERLSSGHSLLLWGREEADLADDAAVEEAARGIEFDAIVNAAAFTEVDRCESDYDLALRGNRDAVRNVARLARERGARLVTVSTDYVFDGTKREPYLESDPTSPVNAYGRSKLAGEEEALSSGAAALVVRTSWLFGPGGKNFVDTIAGKLERGEALEVVDDQRGSPTYTRDLAHGIARLLSRGATGIVNVTNTGETTWYGFAVEIARYLGSGTPIAPIGSDRIRRPAARPAYSVLSGDRYARLVGERLPRWEEALHHYLAGRSAAPGAAA